MPQPNKPTGLWARVTREARMIKDRITGRGFSRRFTRVEQLIGAARTTYIGNNRLLLGMTAVSHEFIFLLDAEDRLLMPSFVTTGVYDPGLTQYIADSLSPDSHCIDVGANFGYFTCIFGMFSPHGKVIGIEVEDRNVALARENIAVNGLVDIARIVHAAASDSNDEVKLYRRSTRSGNTSIAYQSKDFTDLLGESPVEPFTIGGIRIDDLAAEMGGRVDFMKIDIEGAEPLAIAGARQTITANPQIQIAMEWSPGQIQQAGFDVSQFVASLTEMGLRAYDMDFADLIPLTAEQLIALPYRPAIILKR